jgi:D-alanyl-D-alanine carboxypeptidase
MTSGIPSYDQHPGFHADYAADRRRHFTAEDLVSYAAGGPATAGWSYSNTNYVLAEMIIDG